MSAPGTGPSLQEPWAGRFAKDFDICWRKVPREMQASPEDEMCAPTGEARGRQETGWGDGAEKGEFLKDNFLRHLISTDF